MDTTSAAPETAATAAGREAAPAWHTLAVDEAASLLGADLARGLTDAEAARRRQQFGPNALAEAKGRSPLAILVDQFKSLIVALLVVATVVAFVFDDTIEGFAILAVIILNAAVGFLTDGEHAVRVAHECAPGGLGGRNVVLREVELGAVGVAEVALAGDRRAPHPPVEFVDEQVEVPYAQWIHRDRFTPTPDGGTLVEDEVQFRLPFGRLGSIAAPLVRRQLRRIFEYRRRVIADLSS